MAKQHDNLINLKLYRNKAGQIIKKIETLNGNKTTYTYRYDDRGRLTAVRLNRKLVEKYSYDSNGNRILATSKRRGVINQLQSYTPDDQIKLIGQLEQTYDEDGYLKTKTLPDGESYTFTYGTRGELKETTTTTSTGSVTVISYQHNALNQRVSKEINGTTVEKYLWQDLTTLLAVYDKDNNLVQRFEYADGRMPVAMTDGNGTKYYLHYDQVGSLRAISRVLSPDNTFEVIKEITYDTYGNIINDSNPTFRVPFGFAGGLYDADTKLTRFGYRDYDAYTGKWTAKDPIGFDGGDSNLYGYVLGDPVNLVDPSGLSGKKPLDLSPSAIRKVTFCKYAKKSCVVALNVTYPQCTGIVCQLDIRSLFSDCLNNKLECGKDDDNNDDIKECDDGSIMDPINSIIDYFND